MRSLFLCTIVCVSLVHDAPAQLPRLAANDNRAPAGVLKDGVLTLDLQLTTGMWHPDAEDAAGIDVITFGEVGRPASIPAPLIRVPRGTTVRTTLTNTLAESMVVYGLGASHALADSVRLQPGESREFVLQANEAGNYMYGAWTRYRVGSPEAPTVGYDMVAAGAFIVDEPGAAARDRVFVISMMVDTIRLPRQRGLTSILVTFNGKSWPHSETLTHDVGDTITWRVINTSLIPHPMHLHGFYFDVLARGSAAADTIYAPSQVRKAVTERLPILTSMTMRWVPERAGNWLFHCHLTAHTQLHVPLGATKASHPLTHKHDAPNGMSNLMMGIIVRGPEPRDRGARRQLRLHVDQHDSIAGEFAPRFTFSLGGSVNQKTVGPPIILRQNEPTAITVVNRAREATAVHWHGIELESFNDGVAGFGGYAKRISPLIEPGDSFVALMTPPRAGTFIYHTHVDEPRQQRGGLYGGLIVMPPSQQYDPVAEPLIVLGTPNDTTLILFNGEQQPIIPMQLGRTYRLRMIHIMTVRPNLYLNLVDGAGKSAEWKLVAKDGADLPEHQAQIGTAKQFISNGETFDVLYTPSAPGDWKLEARAANGTYLGHAVVRVNE